MLASWQLRGECSCCRWSSSLSATSSRLCRDVADSSETLSDFGARVSLHIVTFPTAIQCDDNCLTMMRPRPNHLHFPSSPPFHDPADPASPPLLADTPRRRIHSTRANTLPSSPRATIANHATPQKHQHTPRRFSTSSSSSSSLEQSPPTAGIGRKVAESLELFKESEERPEPASSKRRLTTSHPSDAVAEARYEFVKRADWPDPETAALRRERSSTALENVRARESVDSLTRGDPDNLSPCPRDPLFSDPSIWRKDLFRQDPSNRGRRRRRASDISTLNRPLTSLELSPITVPQSPCIRPRSRAYPPSPSPSRSPTDRIPPLALYSPPIDLPSVFSEPHLPELSSTYFANQNRSHSRSPTPTHISPHPSTFSSPPPKLPSPSRSVSPWTTDDESAWETSSATSDISTTSGTSEHPLSFSQVTDPLIDSVNEGDMVRKSQGGAAFYNSDLWNADSLSVVYGDSKESLPHIPLRPFRNQVGGHSAIYKFTKRAVCKVSACACAMTFS